MIFGVAFSILTASTWLSTASRQIYISHHRTSEFMQHSNKNDNNIVRCLRCSAPFDWTKLGKSNHSHYTMRQLVKYSKKWNSYDLIANVNDLNNENNVVVKWFKIRETFRMHFNCYNIYTHWSTSNIRFSNALHSIESIFIPPLIMHWK